ncbi:hypothetical protein B9Z55_007985 [Caenorhabditis nigoni]|uniref:EGF-like domain-containing protein n=1 Tax=Caenorhabditis nigoni TaxID=1611254 RepID=A0A2G5VCQ8_9PELO|nr:hypothetical protein B9Z55_007985 [Caenorhabditis nigoni]
MAIISVRTELHMCSKSCGFRGICYEASGTFLCRCPRGFIGDECDTLVNQLTLEPIGFGYCRISITGLVGIHDVQKKSEAILDIQNAISSLNQAIRDAYGGQAIVELLNFKAEDSSEDVTSSETWKSEFENLADSEFTGYHKIQKRETSGGIPGVREPTEYSICS